MAAMTAALLGPERDEVVGQGMPNFHPGGAILMNLRALSMGQTLLMLTLGGAPGRAGPSGSVRRRPRNGLGRADCLTHIVHRYSNRVNEHARLLLTN